MMAWKIPSVYQKIRYFAAFSKFFYQSDLFSEKIFFTSVDQKMRYIGEFYQNPPISASGT